MTKLNRQLVTKKSKICRKGWVPLEMDFQTKQNGRYTASLLRGIFPVLLAVSSACLPYRGERRAEEAWTIQDESGRPLSGIAVQLQVVEGNCMALSHAGNGRIIERASLQTDARGQIHTQSERVWRIYPCIFATDQGTCVRHCYVVDDARFRPMSTCEDESAVNMTTSVFALVRPKFPRWSKSMRDSMRSSCKTVPYVAKRSRDVARYCECLERRLDGSIAEDRFLRMSDAEVEAMLPSIDQPCR